MRRRLVSVLAVLALLLACAGSAQGAALYLPDYGSGPPETISGYSLAADGTPSPLPGSPFAVGPVSGTPGGIVGLGFTPDGTRAVTGFLFHGGVLGLAAGPGGSLAPAQTPITEPSVTGIAVTPDGRFAYASTRKEMAVPAQGILGFSIGPTGALTPLPAPFGSGEYQDIAITPDGRWLYASDGSSIDRFAIGPDGKLSGEVENVGFGAFLQVSADGRFLFGGESTSVFSYAIGLDGSLTQVGEPLSSGTSSFGYFAVAADGRHLYLPDRNANAIVTVAIAANGALSAAGSTSVEVPNAVGVTPNGRFLYYASYEKGKVGVASIGADGVPTMLPATAPWATGEPARITFRPARAPTAYFTVPPVAVPVAAGATGTAGTAIHFDAGLPAEGVRYEWSFGDGTTLADGGPTPSHTYGAPGSYTVKLTAYDALGCSGTLVYTGQSTICPAGTASQTSSTVQVAAPPVRPAISSLRLTRSSFLTRLPRHSKGKPGTTFLYELNVPAGVIFKIERRIAGRRVAGKCKPKTKTNKKRSHCVVYRTVGSLSTRGIAGKNSLAFSGKLNGKPLVPGRYRATAVASAYALVSPPATVGFKVLAHR